MKGLTIVSCLLGIFELIELLALDLSYDYCQCLRQRLLERVSAKGVVKPPYLRHYHLTVSSSL